MSGVPSGMRTGAGFTSGGGGAITGAVRLPSGTNAPPLLFAADSEPVPQLPLEQPMVGYMLLSGRYSRASRLPIFNLHLLGDVQDVLRRAADNALRVRCPEHGRLQFRMLFNVFA